MANLKLSRTSFAGDDAYGVSFPVSQVHRESGQAKRSGQHFLTNLMTNGTGIVKQMTEIDFSGSAFVAGTLSKVVDKQDPGILATNHRHIDVNSLIFNV